MIDGSVEYQESISEDSPFCLSDECQFIIFVVIIEFCPVMSKMLNLINDQNQENMSIEQ